MSLIYFLKLIFHERCLFIDSFVELLNLIDSLFNFHEIFFRFFFGIFFIFESMANKFLFVIDGLELINADHFVIIFEETFLQIFDEGGLKFFVKFLFPIVHDS